MNGSQRLQRGEAGGGNLGTISPSSPLRPGVTKTTLTDATGICNDTTFPPVFEVRGIDGTKSTSALMQGDGKSSEAVLHQATRITRRELVAQWGKTAGRLA